MIKLVALPALADNYIWLAHGAGNRVLVVDPGDPAPVIAYLSGTKSSVAAILLTHHHADHIGGAPALRERFASVVIAPVDERIHGVDTRVAEGAQVTIAGFEDPLCTIEVPGHTRTHIAATIGGLLFCGDTLFSAGCGRLFEGTPAQMLASLNRLVALTDGTLVCCGHEYTEANCRFAVAVEPDNQALRAHQRRVMELRAGGRPTLPSTIALEREINPFLRCAEPGVRAAVERHAGRRLDDEVAVFAALRAWKNEFRG